MSARREAKIGKQEKSSFHNRVDNKDRAIVLFYATWCPFSQAFLPIFEEYARNNPDDCLSVIADDEPDVCDEYDVEYYPTVIMFKQGKVHKRLDSKHHIGLNKKQFKDFTK
jgi:thiol-disulfide isomerase/thioredoxin